MSRCSRVALSRGTETEVGVQTPLNLATIITRDWIGIDLFPGSLLSSSPSSSPSLPPGSFEGPGSCQGCHSRQPSPSTAPTVAMAMDGTCAPRTV